MERVTEKQTSSCSNNGGIISATTPSLNVEQHGIILENNNNSIKHFEKPTHHQDQTGWRKLVSFVGPGFLVSLAYLDPGNLETDLQAGANNKFQLLWVVLIGLIFALIIQSLAANLGVSTGKHLAELCKAEYPVIVNYCLWLLAEVAVIAADIPDVIGTAFALNLLLQIPVWCGVLLTGLNTILLLGLQKYGVRKLEMVIAILIFVMAACFFGELSYMKPPATDVIKGMFVPKVTGQRATGDTIALLGALIMPHNLFLHSAIVLSRKIPNTVQDINQACRFFLLESGFALIIAFLINVAVVTVSGTACSGNITPEVAGQCSELTLNSASFLLKNVLGNKASIIYAVALLASGQSSAVNCTYAGQYIMQGFLDLKMKTWLRNLVTRSIAITPSLIVSIIGGSEGAGRLIVIASMILSFELPFALIPLLKFSSSSTKMGPHKNSIYIIIISWILGLGIIGINVYYLTTSFIGWLIDSKLPKVANVFLGVMVFPLMVVYVIAVGYLMFRKDRVVTFIEPTKAATNAQDNMEGGIISHHDEELN